MKEPRSAELKKVIQDLANVKNEGSSGLGYMQTIEIAFLKTRAGRGFSW